MSRYVLKFYKKGNMRFISHLDLQRLFRRALYKAEIPVSFSQGFNPHPITNIVQPLSLGFEAECDYFEFEAKEELNAAILPDLLNTALPDGIKFTDCKKIPHEKKNLSSVCEYSQYKLFIPLGSIDEDLINNFLAQDKITVLKKDKKTKQMVEKDIRNWIFSVSDAASVNDGVIMDMVLRAAPNETVNPLSLAESMLKFMNIKLEPEDIRISRIELFCTVNNKLLSLFERY